MEGTYSHKNSWDPLFIAHNWDPLGEKRKEPGTDP